MYDESSEEATRLLPWARLENAAHYLRTEVRQIRPQFPFECR
jgi:hypothetical protein